MSDKEKSGNKRCSRMSTGIIVFCILILIVAIAAGCGIWGVFSECFRLDQYATTIFGTTSGIVGTMFGLTAASYAFIWSDLRSDKQENRHLGKVLECYSQKLWNLFKLSLLLTVAVIFTSLIGLAIAQHITDLSLFKPEIKSGTLIFSYENTKTIPISMIVLLNLSLSAIAVGAMAWMNWDIFKRNSQYADIAKTILDSIQNKYNLELPNAEKDSENIDGRHQSIEYEKIHNLEILMERILKNHESIGDAFAETQRREKLLVSVITRGLTEAYGVTDQLDHVPENIRRKTEWEYLEETKKNARWEKCRKIASEEYEKLTVDSMQKTAKHDKIPRPMESSFITVYDDLLTYRDNSLVWEERKREKTADIYGKRTMRYTVKKRLLLFYMRGETFSGMDLTGISLSGADLRFTNFSGCNLTGIRLKGANCEGADFTGSRMSGMYFEDVPVENPAERGEIQLSCIDKPSETEDAWDPYKGREITCLREATFKEADVSRAYLEAPDGNMFSLEGTNFDYAKMFFSFFKNIDFTNASLEKTQMYNMGMIHSIAKSANFSKATLTNSCLAWCNFENADFSDASMAETVLLRNNFGGAKMSNANFSYSNIIACDFEGASCQNASFQNVIQDLERLKESCPKALEGVSLGDAKSLKFSYATLTNTDFSGAKLDKVVFEHAIGQNCIFTKTTGVCPVFDHAVFNSTIFNTTRFIAGSFRNTVLRNSVFSDTWFINCFFDRTDFTGVLFTRLDRPCFMGGIMVGVSFSDASGLTVDSFRNVCLDRVDFRGTGLRKQDFESKGIENLEGCIFEES